MSALAEESAIEYVNEVRLVGRLGADPVERELPSGDTLWTFRINVARPAGAVTGSRSGQRVDSLDCAVWSGRAKRSVPTWTKGDLVEVTGAIRKRFFQAGGVTASRVEVEVSGARLIRRGVRRAASG